MNKQTLANMEKIDMDKGFEEDPASGREITKYKRIFVPVHKNSRMVSRTFSPLAKSYVRPFECIENHWSETPEL